MDAWIFPLHSAPPVFAEAEGGALPDPDMGRPDTRFLNGIEKWSVG